MVSLAVEVMMSSQPPSPAGPGAPFRIVVDPAAGRAVLSGRLDRRTASLLGDAVSALLAGGCPEWIVDASGLTVADHAALRAIGAAYRRAIRHGRRLTILGTSPALHAALTRLRLDHHVLGARDRSPVPIPA
ncbi:STAS domain-containing protein [Geodermatophilus sp. SYSU D00965]